MYREESFFNSADFRAMYLCTSGDMSFWQHYLLNIGLDEQTQQDNISEMDTTISDNNNFSFKARALKCFCAITDEGAIKQLTNLTSDELL